MFLVSAVFVNYDLDTSVGNIIDTPTGILGIGYRPVYQIPAVKINNGYHVYISFFHRYISNTHHPNLVRFLYGEMPDQVWIVAYTDLSYSLDPCLSLIDVQSKDVSQGVV